MMAIERGRFQEADWMSQRHRQWYRLRFAHPVLLLLLLALPGCQGGCGRRDPGPGGLAVALTIPHDAVTDVTSVDVLFDLPMVAIGMTTASVTPPPFTIRPRVAGRYRWIGTRTASFVPDAPFAPATRYEGRVPAGTMAANGSTLPVDHVWSFETSRPAVVRALPEAEGAAVGPDVRLVIDFNQPVEPSVVRRSVSLVAADGATINLDVRRVGTEDAELLRGWEADDSGRRVVIQPRRLLPLATNWKLEISAGLKGTLGTLPMIESWSREFRTYSPFTVDSLAASRGQSGAMTLALNNPVDTDSLVAYAVTDPPVRLRGAWQEWDSQRVTLMGDFRPGRTYRVSIRPGLKDAYGQTLTPVTLGPVTIPDAEPSVTLAPNDAVVQRNDRREIAVLLTNVESARLELFRVDTSRIGRVARGRPSDEPTIRGGRPGELVRTVTRRTPWNETDTLFISTDEVLGGNGGGTVLARLESLDPPKPIPGATKSDGSPQYAPPPRARALVRVSNLGLTGKTSESNHLFWLTGLTDARAIAGAAVEVRGASGRLVWSGTTGPEGLVLGDGLPRAEGEDWPLYAVATTADDQIWMTLGGDWNLEPWSFGIAGGNANPDTDLDGMIFGDRDLYRPGDTVHLKGLLRRRSLAGLENPGAMAVRIEVDDPRGNAVLRRNVTLSRFGTMHLDLPLPAGATPGGWSVRVVPPVTTPRISWNVYGSFSVAEYKAPEFKVDLVAAKPWTLGGQAIPIDVSAAYFFGAPLAGATARWSLTRRPYDFRPAGYEEFQFGDPEVIPEYEWLAGRGEAVLDASGHATIQPVADLGATRVSLLYTMEVEVRDQTGRASAATIERPVHRGLAYPGIKTGAMLVTAGESVTADIVLVAPGGQPARSATAQARLYRREWRSVRRLMVGGIIGSETTEVDTLLDRQTLPAGPGPHRLGFSVPGAGYYRIVVEATDGAKNRQQSAATFYAAGPGDYAWGWEPGVRLELVADKKEYRPGDTARILVRAPFTGAEALVTVEREGVLTHALRRFAVTSEIIEVPIPMTGAAPNLYVSVALVLGSEARRGADPRLVKPEFRLGLINLPVTYADRGLRVEVRPERVTAAPQDSIRLDIRLTDAAGRGVAGEFSLAVVDEAVLRLLGTATPDPLTWFYRPRPLSVTTSEVRRQVVRTLAALRTKGGDPGGGGGDDGTFRSDFATTAFWRADLVTDADGRARVGVRLPDNLTTFRVMAVALDDGQRFGSGDTTIVVTKPLLVQAALPRFATTGDRFNAGAIVHNRTDRPIRVQVTADVTGLTFAGTPQPVAESIPAHSSFRFDVPIAATVAGPARVRFQAAGDGVSDGIEIHLPVVDPVIERYDAATGLAAARIEELITLPLSARPESARVEVTLAPSLVGGLAPAFQYLDTYPYGCLEQRASRAWARILEARLFGPAAPIRGAAPSSVAAAADAMSALAAYQVEDGGFVLYPGQTASQVGLTAWALLALHEARAAGADTDRLSEPAVRYLGWQLQAQSADTAAVVTRSADWSLALWAMSLWPRDTAGEAVFRQTLEFLTLMRGRLSQESRLELVLAWSNSGRDPAGHATRILREMDARVEQVADLAWLEDDAAGRAIEGWEWWWRSPVRRNALFLAALSSRPERWPLEPKVARKLLEERRNGRWENTQANILALAALAAYRDRYERETPNLTAHLTFGSSSTDPVRFTERTAPPVTRVWPAPLPGKEALLGLDRSGPGALYYLAALRYRESSVGRPAEESALTLTRAWERFDGAGPLTSGDLVLVRLTLVVPEALDFLVLADPLPAGLEPVQLEFRTSGQEAARRLQDVSARRYTGLYASFTETRDREVRAYFDHVAPGVHEYRYLARAVTPGVFGAPRARAELLYHPEVAAFTDGPTLRIANR